MDHVVSDLIANRLRFNSVVRSILANAIVEVDRPEMGCREDKRKGELAVCNARITEFVLNPRFEKFVKETGMQLPEALQKVPSYSENRSSIHGSPRTRERSGSTMVELFRTLTLFLSKTEISEDKNRDL